jgi:hypothetical protein
MTIALEFLSRLTDRFFEAQMQRVARKIEARAQIFPH